MLPASSGWLNCLQMASPADQDVKTAQEHDGNWTGDIRSFGMLSGIDW